MGNRQRDDAFFRFGLRGLEQPLLRARPVVVVESQRHPVARIGIGDVERQTARCREERHRPIVVRPDAPLLERRLVIPRLDLRRRDRVVRVDIERLARIDHANGVVPARKLLDLENLRKHPIARADLQRRSVLPRVVLHVHHARAVEREDQAVVARLDRARGHGRIQVVEAEALSGASVLLPDLHVRAVREQPAVDVENETGVQGTMEHVGAVFRPLYRPKLRVRPRSARKSARSCRSR